MESLLVNRTSDEEWKLWLRMFSTELLRASPYHCHEHALQLALSHEPFARKLFFPAFAACYSKMSDALRRRIIENLTDILQGPKLPSEVVQELLNLSEFMERRETGPAVGGPVQQIPAAALDRVSGLFTLRVLTERSEGSKLFAKALYYLEVHFLALTQQYEKDLSKGRITPMSQDQWSAFFNVCTKIIELSNVLGQTESAMGVLAYVQRHYAQLNNNDSKHLNVRDAEMLEKLQWWSESLKAYAQRNRQDPSNTANVKGIMNAYSALGNFGRLLEVWRYRSNMYPAEASRIAASGARAAWLLEQWDDMRKAVVHMPKDGYLGTTALFYECVLLTQAGRFRDEQGFIDQCKKALDGDISALVGESYGRAYHLFVGIQQLSELEEIAIVRREHRLTEKDVKELWEARLVNMTQDPIEWLGVLANHTLVLPREAELGLWIRFVDHANAHGRNKMANEVLRKLVGGQDLTTLLASTKSPMLPLLAKAAVSNVYAEGKTDTAMELLTSYLNANSASKDPNIGHCFALKAEWQAASSYNGYPFNPAAVDEVVANLHKATTLFPANGDIWHSWAKLNHDIVIKRGGRSSMLPSVSVVFVDAALNGYLMSIKQEEKLQDVLGFLSLWFSTGAAWIKPKDDPQVTTIERVNVHVWLSVLPQIIARVTSPNPELADSVYKLLSIVAKAHPQALVYTLNSHYSPITEPTANDEPQKRRERLLEKVVEYHDFGRELVDTAALVCRELVRCAVHAGGICGGKTTRRMKKHRRNHSYRFARVKTTLADVMNLAITAR